MTMEEKIQEEKIKDEVNEQEQGFEEEAVEETPEMSAEELAQLLIKMGKEKEESEQRYLRLQADFDNYRKRTQREKDDIVANANFDLFKLLLPIIDNLERATQVSDDTDAASIKEGIQKIIKQFCVLMAVSNVEIVKTLGEEFDPQVHDAIMREAAGEDMSGKVTGELQKGYTMNGKLLRAAMVKVGE